MKKALLSLASLFAAGSLSAADYVTTHVVVPFEFKVDKVELPAGEYRLERDFGKDMVSIVNINTGRRVRVLSDAHSRTPEKSKMIFEKSGKSYRLIKIS
jgi:hypothetical protein